jgi:hypothetical protein
VEQFLGSNVEDDFSKYNKNANGLVRMTNHFGDRNHKAKATEFIKVVNNIKKISNKLGEPEAGTYSCYFRW